MKTAFLLLTRPAVLIATALTALLAGCSQAPTPKPAVSEYQMTGEVLRLDPAAQTASVKAEKIEGWMEAMTMDFPVRDKPEFENLKVGEKIHATVRVQGTEYWLTGISRENQTDAPTATPASK